MFIFDKLFPKKTHGGLFTWKINLQKQTRFFFEQFSKNPWYFQLNFFPKNHEIFLTHFSKAHGIFP